MARPCQWLRVVSCLELVAVDVLPTAARLRDEARGTGRRGGASGSRAPRLSRVVMRSGPVTDDVPSTRNGQQVGRPWDSFQAFHACIADVVCPVHRSALPMLITL